MVTHKCTEGKIKDGVRIIEIPIQSEEQIDNIVSDCKLAAIRNEQCYYNYSNDRNITLHNFNKVEPFDPIGSFDEYEDCFSRKNTIVLWLNSQGQFRLFDCHCYEVSKMLPSNVHYYITDIATPFKEIFQEFSKRGVKICNCFLCKFSRQDSWGERLCVLYKKHNLPRKPSPYCAVSCPHYREDYEPTQDSSLTEQPISIGQSPIRHKFYCYVCRDIL